MKTKICIFTKREFNFVGKSGDNVSGYMYGGVCEDGKVIEFSSKVSTHEALKQVPSYYPDKMIEIDLEARMGTDAKGNPKFKYVENQA